MLTEMDLPVVAGPLRVNYVPDEAALLACRRLGEDLAAKLGEFCNDQQ